MRQQSHLPSDTLVGAMKVARKLAQFEAHEILEW
jgi:hypothetical protein